MPVTTAPVVAQVGRSGRRAQLRRLLRGCELVGFDDEAHDVGALAGGAGVTDVVDAHVVVTAHRLGFGIVTSDEDNLKPISDLLRPRVPLLGV